MIYKKSKLGVIAELGSKQILLQTNDEEQAKPISQADIEFWTLFKTASVYSRNENLSEEELKKIKAVDDVLKKVDVEIVDTEYSRTRRDFPIKETQYGKSAEFHYNEGGFGDGDKDTKALLYSTSVIDKAKEFLGIEKVDGRADNTGDQEILKRVYELSVSDGRLTKEEIERIKKLDEVLPEAKMEINMLTGDAKITYKEEGKDQELNMKFPQNTQQNINVSPKKTR